MNTNKITFFLIDDDVDDRELFALALQDMDAKPAFYEASMACEALSILKNGEVMPDYIFLDLNMPKMNGRECLKELKNTTMLAHIPVIIFSTSSDPRDIAETKAMGAIEFITKPSKTSELTAILNNLLNTIVTKRINQNS
ncbi:MAG TPA: response regulator [Bacteroidia bacterium]|nr:response regulator [Bacteroidia bacterium]